MNSMNNFVSHVTPSASLMEKTFVPFHFRLWLQGCLFQWEALKWLIQRRKRWGMFHVQLKIMYTLTFGWDDRYQSVQFSSGTQSCPTLQPHESQHTRPPCPSPTPGVHPNPYPSSRWCHPTISSSVVSFSSHLQSFPASGSFQMSQFFAWVSKVLKFQLQHQSF